MIFDDKDKCLRLARQILLHYRKRFGTDCSLRLLQLSENITYLVEYVDITEERSGALVDRRADGCADVWAEGRVCGEIANEADNNRVKKAILRLCRPGYHTEEELQAEIEWMRALGEQLARSDKIQAYGEQSVQSERMQAFEEQSTEWNTSVSDFGLCLRQPLPGDDGAYLYTAGEREGEKYYGVVFSYLSGTPLEQLPVEQQGIWFERLGEVTALFHRQAWEWEKSSGLARFHWNYETMLGKDAVWGDWRGVRGLTQSNHMLPDEHRDGNSGFVRSKKESKHGNKIKNQYKTCCLNRQPEDRKVQQLSATANALGIELHREEEPFRILYQADRMIYENLQNYGMTAANYGLIHGDLRGANLLVEENFLKVIDFDDCGFGWYMQDLAASLSFMETQVCVPKLVQAWLRGYQKQGELAQADMDMIPTFIMMRRMQLLAWVHSRADAASAIAYRERFLEGTVMLAEKYVSQGMEYIFDRCFEGNMHGRD